MSEAMNEHRLIYSHTAQWGGMNGGHVSIYNCVECGERDAHRGQPCGGDVRLEAMVMRAQAKAPTTSEGRR